MGFLAPFLPYLIFLVIGGGAVWYADSAWCNKACERQKLSVADQKAVVAKLRAEIEAANTAAFQQQERWNRVVTAEEERARANEAKRAKADLRRRAEDARRDPVSRSVVIPDSARRMLGDAYQAAQAAESASAPTEAAPANSATVADMAAWGIEMLEWAQECQARDLAWRLFYDGLRAETPASSASE